MPAARRQPFCVCLLAAALCGPSAPARAQDKSPVADFLARPVISPKQSVQEVQAYLEPRIPKMPALTTPTAWQKEADRLRREVLERVVFRGAAAGWRDAPAKVEWLGTIPGGPGYRIRKVRYEAVPGLWIPALLYEPDKLAGKAPVSLAVNGHDRNGKAAPYKQIRCINMAKRGMLVLNVEWLGMGQLRTDGFRHGCMNQIDLCGASGLAPFYLAMKRGLDLLLSLPQADPGRVAVSGLSGGGWQTIFISSLDTRVTLSNPVAGYSGFHTRIHHAKDLGDSEQTPCDLATVADYTHLTALRAPRPTLLTYNAKDDCCFEAGYALPPLLEAACPVFKLYGRENALRSHVNHDPGTHNFEKDNRQALYRMLGDFFFAGDSRYRADEIPSQPEVKKPEELAVELPAKNADFNTLARGLAEKLPRAADLPKDGDAARKWQEALRLKLRELVRGAAPEVQATRTGQEEKAGVKATFWRLKVAGAWSVPVTELVRGGPKATVILLNDAGRKNDAVNAERLLAAGNRVLAVDLTAFGEAQMEHHAYLFALMLATVGDRPLGLQANELAAVARWSQAEHKSGPVGVVAVGPRLGTVAVVAAALDEKALGRLELHGAFGSLKEIIEQNRSVDQMPEQFCFGLLEAADVKQLVALIAPRPVNFVKLSPRARSELAGLKAWYATLGADHDPVRE